MKSKWEAEWKGERVYIEVDTAPMVEKWVKSAFWGLFGRAKTKCLLQYGNQIIERREIKEALMGTDSTYDMVGKGMQPDGQEAHFHARITPKITSEKCELKINYEKVQIREIY